MPNVMFKSNLKKLPAGRQTGNGDNLPETIFIILLAVAILLLISFGTFI